MRPTHAADAAAGGLQPQRRDPAQPPPVQQPAAAPPPARVGAPTPETALRRNDNPRSTRINNSQVNTPLTQRWQSGGSTPLSDFARVSTDLATPAAVPTATMPARGLLGTVAGALRAAAGVPTQVQWMQQTMRTLRGEALGADVPAQPDRPPTVRLALGPRAEPDAVARFWQQPAVAGRDGLGPHHAALVAELDRLGAAHGAHVGLGLSLALLAVKNAAGPDAPPPGVGALRALRGPDALQRVLHADAAAQAADPDLGTAVALLRRVSRSNQFGALATALAPALRPAQLPPLRRLLEADRLLRPTQPAGPGDARVAERPLSMQRMAQRVSDAARQELRSGPASLSAQQTVESFYWDNHFRDDAPGSELAQLKQHFAQAVRELGREPATGGVLSAAYRFGLAGADRHLLTDEAGRLAALRDSPAIDAVVATLRGALDAQLQAARHGPVDPLRPNLVARTIAQQVALEAWSPEHKATLSLEEMVRGRAFPRMPPPEVDARIEAACTQFLQGGDGAQRPGAAPAAERDALRARVRGELSLVRLGFEEFGRLAKQLGLRLDAPGQRALERADTLIHAHTRMPGARTPQAVGGMVAEFLSGVYFGNHIKLSHASGAALSARGLGLNATSALESGFAADASLAVVPLANGSIETAREQVFRAGAATHGAEIFLGQDTQFRRAQGVGALVGYPNDGSTLARFAAGIDVRARGLDTSRYEGVMLRVDRRIVEDREGEQGTRVFRQNEGEVRATAEGIAHMLFERAATARSDDDRERLLEDLIVRFQGQGLSMTLLRQQAEAHRSDVAVGTGLSVAGGTDDAGLRVGASVTVGVEHGHSTSVRHADKTGSYQVNNLRTGWFERRRISGGAGANAYVGAVGLPPTPLLRGTVAQGESGGSVRVRVPLRQGQVVAEKSFSDTETADPRFFKEIVLADKRKWVDLFAFQHRDDPDPQARGEETLNAFFHTIESMRAGNHVYYARERLHPDVGQRLDELTSLAALAPATTRALHDEIAQQRGLLASDDRSWGPASLIAYERNGEQQGAALSVGVQLRHVSAVEGEREFVFQTPGWADLRARERSADRFPGSLVDLDHRAASVAAVAPAAAPASAAAAASVAAGPDPDDSPV
ncbi:hypothetical protein ACPOLB_24940 [Rubrivivax sp. RP6-9]|uniref:hypothetical protein n=1 Tax=Rubrivivax sp. RP6-9 TaxID=3415750 RepID=UPI003CC5AA7E